MALVVFLRGVNVGGHRTFRPSRLAKDLREFDVVSIGAAGTFVARNKVAPAKLRAALQAKLGFETNIAICDGNDLLALESRNPFGREAARPDVVRFVSVFEKDARIERRIPFSLPAESNWLVRVIAAKGHFVFGEYRRHMKTIGYLGQLDKLFGASATTRNWNTIVAIIAVLKDAECKTSSASRRRATKQD